MVNNTADRLSAVTFARGTRLIAQNQAIPPTGIQAPHKIYPVKRSVLRAAKPIFIKIGISKNKAIDYRKKNISKG